MKIVTLIDETEVDPDDPQFEDESVKKNRLMEFYVASAIRSLKHKVHVMPFNPNVRETIRELTSIGPDLVFNLTELVEDDRCKDVHVVALLELLKIPYTGAGPIGMMLGRDKALSKDILRRHGLKTPDFVTMPVGTLRPPRKIKFPLLLKLQLGDSSEHITRKSLVRDEDELATQLRLLHRATNEPVICEEYIEGRELKVFIVGNRKLHVYPIGEVRFGSRRRGGPTFQTKRVKDDPDYRRKWKIFYRNADLPPKLKEHVIRQSKEMYRLLHLRDYGRLDLRLTADGEAYFLEANPNPSIYPYGVGGVESWAGSYPRFIGRIIKEALQRQ